VALDRTGAVNRLAFEAFVEQVLAPSLHTGDLVVMDNLSSHKGPRTAALTASRSERDWSRRVGMSKVPAAGRLARVHGRRVPGCDRRERKTSYRRYSSEGTSEGCGAGSFARHSSALSA
jgi:hypothetical protein